MTDTIETDAPDVFPLARNEEELFAHCEDVIARGVTTFVEVGAALAEIQKGKLYRAEHATFEAYCFDRWSIGRGRAYQLIGAAAITQQLSTTVDTPPTNEREARAIAKAPPESRPAVIARADALAGSEKRTAKHIAQAVEETTAPDLPLEFSIVQRRYALHDYVLSATWDGVTRRYIVRKEGGTGAVMLWDAVLSRLERLEDQAEPDTVPPPASVTASSYAEKEARDGARLSKARANIEIGDETAARYELDRIEVAMYQRDQLLKEIGRDDARAFLADQQARLKNFSPTAMISQTTFKQALDHIQALLEVPS